MMVRPGGGVVSTPFGRSALPSRATLRQKADGRQGVPWAIRGRYLSDAMDETEIWRAAKLLLDQYGIFAEDKARGRQLDLLSRNDSDGPAVWGRIRHAIGELQRAERREGKSVQ
ncbi:MAG: hypothetical protein ACREFP_11110 [Acetobacteraceae bacterium]